MWGAWASETLKNYCELGACLSSPTSKCLFLEQPGRFMEHTDRRLHALGLGTAYRR